MTNNKKHILIVCRGNILRSPFAETIINREISKLNLQNQFDSFSRGIQGTKIDPIQVKFSNITFYKDIYPLVNKSLKKYSVDPTSHVSRYISHKDVKYSSIVFAMDEITFISLHKLFPSSKNKIHKLSEIVNDNVDFIDPVDMKSERGFELIFDKIFETIQNGFPKLLALANGNKKL